MLGVWGQHHRAHGISSFEFWVLRGRSQYRLTQNPKRKTPSGSDLDLVFRRNIVLKENIPLAIPHVSMEEHFEHRS